MKKVYSLFLMLFFSTFFISCTEEDLSEFNLSNQEVATGGENEKSDPPEEPPSEEGEGN